MAWPSAEGSCKKAGDACSSGWLERCEKGQAQLVLLLPPLSAAGLISYSRHASAWCLWRGVGVRGAGHRAVLPRRQSVPSTPPAAWEQPTYLTVFFLDTHSKNKQQQQQKKPAHNLASSARSADVCESKSAHLLQAKMRNKMPKSGPHSKTRSVHDYSLSYHSEDI